MFSTLLRGYSGNNWWCVTSLCGGIVTSTLCSAYGKAIKKYACTFWKYFFFFAGSVPWVRPVMFHCQPYRNTAVDLSSLFSLRLSPKQKHYE
jgi:hypothetical protein